MIIRVSIWKPRTVHPDRRVYVEVVRPGPDGKPETTLYLGKSVVVTHEGCLYRTGSKYHPTGEIEGTLTDEEWAEARRDHTVNGAYQNYYHPQYNDIKSGVFDPFNPTANAPAKMRPYKCPDCGEYSNDCIGGCRS